MEGSRVITCPTADGQIGAVQTFVAYCGHNVHNSGAGTVVAYIREGTSTSGKVVDVIECTAGKVSRGAMTEPIICDGGIYFDLISGTGTDLVGTIQIQ